MIKRFLAIGIAVENLDAAEKKYSDVLGLKSRFMPAEHFAISGLEGASFRLGNVQINLVASAQTDTPIARLLKTRGEGLLYAAVEVTDIEKDMKDLTKKGMKFINDEPLPFPEGKINFSQPKSMHGIMWAILQAKPGFDLSDSETWIY